MGGAIWWMTRWSAADHKRIGAHVKDPAAQALWEAYALLLALRCWEKVLVANAGPLVIRGDAQGVLQAVVARRARQPSLNQIVAEMALSLSASSHDLSASRWWSEDNAVCDKLSRLAPGELPPSELVGIPQVSLEKTDLRLLRVPGLLRGRGRSP